MQWRVHLVEPVSVSGFVSRACAGAVRGPHPQCRQLVLVLPTEKFDTDKGAILGAAKGVQW